MLSIMLTFENLLSFVQRARYNSQVNIVCDRTLSNIYTSLMVNLSIFKPVLLNNQLKPENFKNWTFGTKKEPFKFHQQNSEMTPGKTPLLLHSNMAFYRRAIHLQKWNSSYESNISAVVHHCSKSLYWVMKDNEYLQINEW